MRIDRIDHLVLTCRDIEATIAFYTRVLRMESVTFDDGRRALTFGRQKLNLHQQGHEFEPKGRPTDPGSVDICFIADGPTDAIVAHLRECRLKIEEGPVERTVPSGR